MLPAMPGKRRGSERLFKVSLPEGFQPVKSALVEAAFRGPGDTWLHIGSVKLRWIPVISGIQERLLYAAARRIGPERFIEPIKDNARSLLKRSAEPGTLEILSEEHATIATRPALLVISTYSRGRKVRSHLYYTLSRRGEPVMVGFTAPDDDDMAWTKPILDGLELLS
ncbi:MAG TPA: hypothetical protein VGV88_12730 [Candidatus Dormibacteraeota bacterium]|nr:hypothetical protein [Candidatus Dormibacteraeota bacterium]